MKIRQTAAIDSNNATRRRVRVLVYLATALLFGCLLVLEWLHQDRSTLAIAQQRGQALISVILTVREWNAQHGGVYVLVRDAAQPNPYLKHLRRDLLSTEGERLTMVNPALMTREISDLTMHSDGVRLRIASLHPLRPDNMADSWESKVLRSFAQEGGSERIELVEEQGQRLHRYMVPLHVTESCLQCHAEHGYLLGGIQGGISVSMPAEPLLSLRNAQRKRLLWLFLGAFVLASSLIHYLFALLHRHVRMVDSISAEQERLIALRTAELKTSNANLAREAAHRLQDQRRLEASESRYRAVFDSAAEGIMLIDENMDILQVNPAFSVITGYTADEVRGHGLKILGSGRHEQDFFDDIQQTLIRCGRWQGEVWNRRKSGDAYVQWMSITRASLPGEEGAYVVTLTDITLRKEAEQRMQYRANHDPLTGMPNRALFEDRLEAALATAQRSGERFAVLFIDLDRFKQVNDSLGHPAGDALLIESGARILECVRASDTVARFGGDEFAAILTALGGIEDAEEVAQRVCATIAQPFFLPQGEARVAASVGIALWPEHGRDSATLESHADQALYVAKRSGGNRWQVYAPREADGRLTQEHS